MDDSQHTGGRLSFWTFLRLFFRSFFLQGSFSERYRQNMGFAFCMDPVGRKLWTEPEEKRRFIRRHMDDYNGNPFMSPLVLGAVTRLEEQLKHGDGIGEDDIIRFKRAIGPATGAIGDRYFWGAVRPFSLVCGMFAAYYIGMWGVVVFLAVFNLHNLLLRWHWLKKGYHHGTGVVVELKNRRLSREIEVLESAGAVLLSFLASTLMVGIGRDSAVLSAATLLVFTGCLVYLKFMRRNA